jgi:putative chitinase
MDIAALQARLGVNADGVAGPGTWTALFVKCGAAADRAAELGLAAARWFPDYGVAESALRLAHFMAQLIHESGGFRYMEEIASGAAYEGRGNLGNSEPGDGRRFKGRGPIQITGRANYRRYGARIGIDLERHPEIAAYPSIGLHLALEYWARCGLNTLADADNVLAITKLINGGTNGLADRQQQLKRVKGLLGGAGLSFSRPVSGFSGLWAIFQGA